jgi:hypothetical protein
MTNAEQPPELLLWIERWYAAHCDGIWEHSHGVHMTAMAARGWRVSIDLSDTKSARHYTIWKDCRTATNAWYCYRFLPGLFVAFGDFDSLYEVLCDFRRHVEQDDPRETSAQGSLTKAELSQRALTEPETPRSDVAGTSECLLRWLGRYCAAWQTKQGAEEIVDIGNLDNPGWRVKILMAAIKPAKASADDVWIEKTDNGDVDWVFICQRQDSFGGVGDPSKLVQILCKLVENVRAATGDNMAGPASA